MKESLVEKYLKKEVTRHGGLCLKWSSPAHRGVPDRIVFLYGKVYFIELKSEEGKLTRLQTIMFDNLSELGFDVRIIRWKEAVDAPIKENDKL